MPSPPVEGFRDTPEEIERQWWGERRHPHWAKEITFPVASGWIAGESLMGVVLVMWDNGPALLRALFSAGRTPAP